MASITPAERLSIPPTSPSGGLYDDSVDRESAYEALTRRVETPAKPSASSHESFQEAAIKSFACVMGSSAARRVMNTIGRELVVGGLAGSTRQ